MKVKSLEQITSMCIETLLSLKKEAEEKFKLDNNLSQEHYNSIYHIYQSGDGEDFYTKAEDQALQEFYSQSKTLQSGKVIITLKLDTASDRLDKELDLIIYDPEI